jgi:LmbE family N-acetylglucosaminyl deacetylase
LKQTNKKTILIIAAHPDDELLGCGGAVAKHSLAGDEVYSIIVCEGESLRYKKSVGQETNIEKASKILGIKNTYHLKFPDQKLDTFTLTDIITPIEKIIRTIKPSIVFCQYGGDVNRDHELLFKALLVATRPTETYIKSVYAFDTASSTEWAYPRTFSPDTWIDISDTLDLKIKAMNCYKSELRDYPHPRSLEALKNKAKSWGNQCCMDAAEVFQTIRCSYRDHETFS